MVLNTNKTSSGMRDICDGLGESLFLMIADQLGTAKLISDKLGVNSSRVISLLTRGSQ